MSTPFNAFTLVEFLAFAGLSFLYVRADDSLSPRGKTEYTIIAGILFAILVAVRAPALLTFYRVWAEIGPLYFGYAYANGPLAALFNPASNYYDLAANLSSAVAVSAGLQWWPVVDTGSGLLVALLFPFVVAGTTQSISWRTGILLAVATALYCVTASETFGTALHIKGWGPVYAALVFGSLAFKQPLNRVHIGLLLVLPFTGTPAAFALIIWAAAGFVLRQPYLVRPLVWSIPGLATQIGCALLPATNTGLAVRPFTFLGFASLPDLFLLKVGGAILWPALFFSNLTPGTLELIAAAIVFLGVLGAAVFLARRQPILLLVPIVALQFSATAILAVGGAESLLQSGSGFRYYFAPVATLLIVLAIWASSWRLVTRVAAVAICLCAVLANRDYNAMVDGLFFTPSHTSWSSQATTHLTSPSQTLVNYPGAGGVQLPDCGEYHC
ncbi:hypothetical protein NKH47_04205 [Mesorhizobium sp. M1060]|uniref:hypothetical protein n=1 Tax=unclassified Mesorhizobium TaxID=325217 RepID=UPI00041299A4|nr:hypothetical protein [Mesorhizobium sp. LNJC403B00]